MTNPLAPTGGTNALRVIGSRPEAYIPIDGVMVACTWDDFVAWMNAHSTRRGEYVTVVKDGRRHLDFREQLASDGWLRERGITPPQDRSRQAKDIGAYVTDYGRAA